MSGRQRTLFHNLNTRGATKLPRLLKEVIRQNEQVNVIVQPSYPTRSPDRYHYRSGAAGGNGCKSNRATSDAVAFRGYGGGATNAHRRAKCRTSQYSGTVACRELGNGGSQCWSLRFPSRGCGSGYCCCCNQGWRLGHTGPKCSPSYRCGGGQGWRVRFAGGGPCPSHTSR